MYTAVYYVWWQRSSLNCSVPQEAGDDCPFLANVITGMTIEFLKALPRKIREHK